MAQATYEKLHKMNILIHLMISTLGGIKTREGLFYPYLSALLIKPLTRSNYGTSASLTPKCLYLLPGLMYLGNPDFWHAG